MKVLGRYVRGHCFPSLFLSLVCLPLPLSITRFAFTGFPLFSILTRPPHFPKLLLTHTQDDMRHGKGIFTFVETRGDGSHWAGSYEGSWVQNKRHGRGVFKYPNGDLYEGNWSNNHKHGYGRYVYANGDVYEGEFKSDMMHGQGECCFFLPISSLSLSLSFFLSPALLTPLSTLHSFLYSDSPER